MFLANQLFFRRLLPLAALSLALAIPLHATLTISEFVAANQTGLLDADGQASDWIEITNDGPIPVSLLGYHLTDNAAQLTKWSFPDVTVGVNGYLVVFASGKNRAVAGAELHTNFSLNESGEYLALVAPNGVTVVDDFAPTFPNQYPDISYGHGTGGAIETRTLFTQGSDSRWFIPLSALAVDWRGPAFDDSGWNLAPLSLGYGYDSLGIVSPAGNLTAAMRNKNPSAFIRIPFEVGNPAEVVTLTLATRHEDGFVAYLNGQVVATDNNPSPLLFNSLATGSREVGAADPFGFYPLDFAGKLVAGTNILAFQLLNDATSSSDVLLQPELKGEFQDLSGGVQEGFFDPPTPNAPNGLLRLARPGTVVFAPPTQGFTGTREVALSVPGAPEGTVIRYTTDGTIPTNNQLGPSPEYTAPLTFSATTQLRAKAFLGGALDAKSRTEAYFRLTTDAANATSNLPIILLDSFGTGAPYGTESTLRRPMMMAIFEPKGDVNPRSSMLNPPDLVTRIGARKRGSSSSSWPKYALSIESWDETNWVAKTIDPLDLGGENDWVLSSRYQFDLSLFRNDFIYEISRQAGRYAAETRFVEVYNNVNGGDVDGRVASNVSDYFGVYSLMHKLDRDDDRIDVAGLDATITTEPDISGGYIFKKDRPDPGDPTFSVGGMGALVHVYPNGGPDPNKPDAYYITTAQRNWLVAYCNNVNTALNAASGINPTTGLHFSEYIEVDSFIDHVWLNSLAMNVDWGRLSAWFFKDRGEKLNGGPIWDFDRTMGCDNDGRAADPRRWDGSGDASRTWYDSRYPWYGRVLGYSSDGQAPPAVLSTRPAEFQRSVDRWFELRKGPFSVANMNAVIDSMAAEINEAQARNFMRWTTYLPTTNSPSFSGGVTGWPGEVAQLKGWLAARVAWIDSQFPAPPIFNRNGGVVPEGFEVVITAPAGSIYYTTDGSDPRLPDGSISPTAILFNGSPAVVLNVTTYLTARSKNGTLWSAPTSANFVIGSELASASNLVVSQLMYHPGPPSAAEMSAGYIDADDFEYIEFMNIGSMSIDLTGVRFSAGLTFDFTSSGVTSLAPGERALIVKNLAAFQQRYGPSLDNAIAGVFGNGTGLNNGGEQLAILDAAGNPIKDFRYRDIAPWPTAADGDGYALVLVNPMTNPDHNVASNWRVSVLPGGSPGAGDSVPFTGDPDADGDFDHLSAFAEYALGTNTMSSASGPGVISSEAGPGGTMLVRFPRNLAADDAVIVPEVSFDLVTYSSDPADISFVSETPVGDGTATMVYEVALPPGADEAFVRLHISSR